MVIIIIMSVCVMMWIVTYDVPGTVLEPLYFGSRDGGITEKN